MYIFCRGKPSSAVFPQRLKGNLRVLTFPSARLIIKQEEKQVEGPQYDGEIFLFSSATACWSPSWGLPPPAIPASNLPFISSSCLPSFLPTFSFISCPHPSFSSSSPSFVQLNIDSHFFSAPALLDFFPLPSQIFDMRPAITRREKIEISKA